MENELMVRSERKPLTAEQIKAQVRLIQEVMNAVMTEGHHYGVIPGTPKPTLYKPGAEKLLSTFHIGADPTENITDLSTEDEIRYRVAVRGFSQATGDMLGVGIGECSSSEEKYKWRKPVCEEEFNEIPTERKRIVWKHGKDKPYQQKQVRMNPVDIANTILKMAKKRALIDMTLTITAASDIFDQDIEDLPEGMEIGANGKQTIKEPQKKTQEPQKKNGNKPPEAQSITSAIESVEIKTGKGPKGPWTLYIIHTATEKYNTFSDTLGTLAKRSIEEKLNAVITWSETPKGKKLVNIVLDEPPAEEEEREPGQEG